MCSVVFLYLTKRPTPKNQTCKTSAELKAITNVLFRILLERKLLPLKDYFSAKLISIHFQSFQSFTYVLKKSLIYKLQNDPFSEKLIFILFVHMYFFIIFIPSKPNIKIPMCTFDMKLVYIIFHQIHVLMKFSKTDHPSSCTHILPTRILF